MKNNSENPSAKLLRPGVKTALKWLFFTVSAVFMYTSSTSGGGKPQALLLFPMVCASAVFETEIPSAVFGAAAGLLLDVSLGKLPGFTALWLCLCCAGISALFGRLLRKNIINFLWVFLLVGGIYLYIDYYFYYKIWAYEGYRLVLKARLIPSALKTLGWALPVYAAVYVAERLSGTQRKLDLEEQDKNIDRV